MGGSFTTDTFFRPAEFSRQSSSIPATIHNACQLLLSRCELKTLFVPIRSMQFQAIVEKEEIIFVDSQGGYAHQDGKGGRLIRIAWQPKPDPSRQSLTNPVPCDIVYYFSDLKEIQWQLTGEFRRALAQMQQRSRSENDCHTARIIPLRTSAGE